MSEDAAMSGGNVDGGSPSVQGAATDQEQSAAQGQEAKESGGAGSLLSGGAQAAAQAEKDTQGEQDEQGDNAPAESPFTLEDLDVPEGFNASQDDLKRFQDVALGMGLNREQAQQLVDMQHANVLAAQQQYSEQVQRWAEDVRTDKDMGGPALATTIMEAKSALGKFDGDGKVFGMLEQTGYANHPEVIRFLSRIGKAMGEDTVVTGKETHQETPLWDRLYPTDKK